MIIGYISLFPFIFHPISYRYFLFKDKSVHNEIYAHMALADERCFARCFCRDFRNIAMRYFRNHKKRPSTIRRLRPVNGLIFGIRFLCSVRQTGIYIIGLPMCLSILHCGGFPSSAQYSSIDTILSFAVLMNDTTWKYTLLSWG